MLNIEVTRANSDSCRRRIGTVNEWGPLGLKINAEKEKGFERDLNFFGHVWGILAIVVYDERIKR